MTFDLSNPVMPYIFIILGLVFLVLSGNYLVKGGVELANHFKISTLVVGVTIVSFGTSAPELIVSVDAAVTGFSDISLGNVIGSNISNIALILGITVIILPMPVRQTTYSFHWPAMMIATLLIMFCLMNDYFVDADPRLNRIEGSILFILLLMYLYISVKRSRKNNSEEVFAKPTMGIWAAILMIVGSCIGLVLGAKGLVNGAAEIAHRMGVSDRVISITIVAFGTSVPELATSVVAAVRKQMDISVGNIIGSNIFNIFGILGIAAIIHPLDKIDTKLVTVDIFWMLGISILLFLSMLPLKTSRIGRFAGLILLLVYISYIALVLS